MLYWNRKRWRRMSDTPARYFQALAKVVLTFRQLSTTGSISLPCATLQTKPRPDRPLLADLYLSRRHFSSRLRPPPKADIRAAV